MFITNRDPFLVVTLILLLVGYVGAQADQSPATFFKDCDTCPELVRISPGVFQMGSTPDENIPDRVPEQRLIEERPAHPVRIDYEFAIGRYEITIADFALFADATDFAAPGCFGLTGSKWEFLADADWRTPGFEVTDGSPNRLIRYHYRPIVQCDYGFLRWTSPTQPGPNGS